MITRSRFAAITGVALALMAGPAAAHHGWSSYDASKEMTLDGVIKESGYEHPHGHVQLEVPRQDLGGRSGAALTHGKSRTSG